MDEEENRSEDSGNLLASNDEEYADENVPSPNKTTIWSIIDSQHKHLSKLRSANDRLIAMLLAVGIDESEDFDQNNEEVEDEETDEMEDDPLMAVLRNQSRQITRFQERNDALQTLLSQKENEESGEEMLNFSQSFSSDDLSDFIENYFQDSGENESTDADDDSSSSAEDKDPYKNPIPQTSTGITHRKPREKKRLRDVPTVTVEDLFGSESDDDDDKYKGDSSNFAGKSVACEDVLDDWAKNSSRSNSDSDGSSDSSSSSEISQNTLEDTTSNKET